MPKEYTIQTRDGCTLLFGKVTVREFADLTASGGPDQFMDNALAALAGASLAWGPVAATAALRAKLISEGVDAADALSVQDDHAEQHPYLKVNGWVATAVKPELRDSDTTVRVARIRDVYRDPCPLDGKPAAWLLDLVLYAKDGKRIGRETPAMGGPTRFEPSCPADFWAPIEKPDFETLGQQRMKLLFAHHLEWIETEAEVGR